MRTLITQLWFLQEVANLTTVLQTLKVVKFSDNATVNYKNCIVSMIPPFYLIISGVNPSGNNAYVVMKLTRDIGPKTERKLWQRVQCKIVACIFPHTYNEELI